MNVFQRSIFIASISLVSNLAHAADELSLMVQVDSQLISIVLVNESTKPASVSEGYALSGLSGGNVVPIVVTGFGQLMPPCGHMDYFKRIKRPVTLRPGQQVAVWSGTAKIIAGLHCLEAGRYDLAFLYMAPNGHLVLSDTSLTIKVGEEFNAEVVPRKLME